MNEFESLIKNKNKIIEIINDIEMMSKIYQYSYNEGSILLRQYWIKRIEEINNLILGNNEKLNIIPKSVEDIISNLTKIGFRGKGNKYE